MTEPVSVPLSAAEIVLVVDELARVRVENVRHALRRLLEKLDQVSG